MDEKHIPLYREANELIGKLKAIPPISNDAKAVDVPSSRPFVVVIQYSRCGEAAAGHTIARAEYPYYRLHPAHFQEDLCASCRSLIPRRIDGRDSPGLGSRRRLDAQLKGCCFSVILSPLLYRI